MSSGVVTAASSAAAASATATATESNVTSFEGKGSVATSRKSKGPRQLVRQEYHKFLLCNPCGPCEWHIEKDVRIFAWFDFIFQTIFVIPVAFLFKSFLKSWQRGGNSDNSAPEMSEAPVASQDETKDAHCDEDKMGLAMIYVSCDLANLSLGMLSDIIIYIASYLNKNWVRTGASVIFLSVAVARELLHVVAITCHMIRCTAPTYPYEITVRLMCHYCVWGFWIVLEYLLWVKNGKQFVPQRGLMEPPIIQFKYADDTSTSTSFTSLSSSWTEGDGTGLNSNPPGAGDTGENGTKKKRRRSKRKSKRRSKKGSKRESALVTTPTPDPTTDNKKTP